MSRHPHTIRRQRTERRAGLRVAGLFVGLLFAATAHAQLGLPNLPTVSATPAVQLPQLPAANPGTLTRQLDAIVVDAASELNSQSQRLLRAARVRALLRDNPTMLEADANGAPVCAVR
jgi:hypothetical protein